MDECKKVKMNNHMGIGELRGNFMADKRKEAFRKAYAKEPNFHQDFGNKDIETDFAKACKLIDTNSLYEEFDNLIRQKLDALAKENKNKVAYVPKVCDSTYMNNDDKRELINIAVFVFVVIPLLIALIRLLFSL